MAWKTISPGSLLSMVDVKCHFFWSSDDQKKWHLTSTIDRRLPGLIVFQAIANQYPDYGSVEDLIKKFKKLSDVRTGTNLVQDIDGANVSALSADRAMHSYKSLLCRRCFAWRLHIPPLRQ